VKTIQSYKGACCDLIGGERGGGGEKLEI